MGQQVDGALAIARAAGGVGDQPHVLAGERGEVFRFQHVDSGFHAAIAQPLHAVTFHQLEVAGQRAAAVQNLLCGERPQRSRHQRGHRRPHARHLAFVVGVYAIGQQNHVGLGDGINPNGSSRVASMSKRAHVKQLAAIGSEGESRSQPRPRKTMMLGGVCGSVIFSIESGLRMRAPL